MALLDLLRKTKTSTDVRASIEAATEAREKAQAAIDDLREQRQAALLAASDGELEKLDADIAAEFRRLDRADAVLAELQRRLADTAEAERRAALDVAVDFASRHLAAEIAGLERYAAMAVKMRDLLYEIEAHATGRKAANEILRLGGDDRSLDGPERIMTKRADGGYSASVLTTIRLPDPASTKHQPTGPKPGNAKSTEVDEAVPTQKSRRELGLAPDALLSPSAARVRRERGERASVCLDSARAALASLEPGGHVFGLTKGQFSMIDLAAAVLEKTGPADVGLWTWAIADYEVQCVTAFMTDRRIRSFRLVLDYSGARRESALLSDLQGRFGSDCVRVTKTHAKIVTVANDAWRVTIRGSMNLNMNPRFEQFDVSDADGAFDVVNPMMGELWARGPALAVDQVTNATARDLLHAGGTPTLPEWAAGLATGRSWWVPK